MNYEKILIFDFETSGLSCFSDEIIEVGAILFTKKNNMVEKKELNILVDSVSYLPPKITEITGITLEDLKEKGVSKAEAFQRLYGLYDENTLLVAYNIAFDLGFLVELFKAYGDKHFELKNDILDVMAIHKDRNKYHHHPVDKSKSLGHKLDSAVKLYNISIQNTHRAIDDVKATYEVLKQMKKEQDNIDCYKNVLGFNAKYGKPRIHSNNPKYRFVAQHAGGGMREIEKGI